MAPINKNVLCTCIYVRHCTKNAGQTKKNKKWPLIFREGYNLTGKKEHRSQESQTRISRQQSGNINEWNRSDGEVVNCMVWGALIHRAAVSQSLSVYQVGMVTLGCHEFQISKETRRPAFYMKSVLFWFLKSCCPPAQFRHVPWRQNMFAGYTSSVGVTSSDFWIHG